MPDSEGKLTQQEREIVVAWVSRYTSQAPCPICGSSDWMLAEYLVQPLTIGPNNSAQIGGIGYPQVMLISNPCGYARLLNAVMIGLLPGNKPESG